MKDRVGTKVANRACNRLRVETVQPLRLGAPAPGRWIAKISGQYGAGSAMISECGGQLRPDLPGRTDDEDSFHDPDKMPGNRVGAKTGERNVRPGDAKPAPQPVGV